MANTSENKYYLKTVHEDIDLYDRKLAHLMKYETFATEADRNAAARKLNLKRELLVKTAKRLVADGMEFSEKDLPRSMRPAEPSPEEAAPVAAVEATVEAEKPAAAGNRSTRRNASAFPSNALGWTLPSSEAKA